MTTLKLQPLLVTHSGSTKKINKSYRNAKLSTRCITMPNSQKFMPTMSLNFLIYAYCILNGFHFNWHFDRKWFSLDSKGMVSAYQLQTLHVCDVVGQDLLTNWWVLYQSYPFWSSLHGSMESSQQWGPWKTGCAFRHILDNLPCPVVFFLAPVTTKLVFAIPSTLYSSPLRILFFVAWPEYLANSFFFKANL